MARIPRPRGSKTAEIILPDDCIWCLSLSEPGIAVKKLRKPSPPVAPRGIGRAQPASAPAASGLPSPPFSPICRCRRRNCPRESIPTDLLFQFRSVARISKTRNEIVHRKSKRCSYLINLEMVEIIIHFDLILRCNLYYIQDF